MPVLKAAYSASQKLQLVRYLGSGTSAEVWRAYSPIHGVVAVKIFKTEYDQRRGGASKAINDTSVQAQHNREITVMQRLTGVERCINVVNYLEEGAESFLDTANSYSIRHFITFEIATGGSLEDLIDERKSKGIGGFSETDAADIIWGMFKGLAFLHENYIYHRDMKPANLLIKVIGQKAHLAITDYGLATILDQRDGSRTKQLCTLGYEAPEMIDKSYDSTNHKTDVFAGGHGMVRANVWRTIVNEREILVDQTLISAQCKMFIKRLLDTNHKTRLSAKDATSNEWLLRTPETSPRVFCRNEIDGTMSFAFHARREALARKRSQRMRQRSNSVDGARYGHSSTQARGRRDTMTRTSIYTSPRAPPAPYPGGPAVQIAVPRPPQASGYMMGPVSYAVPGFSAPLYSSPRRQASQGPYHR